MKLDVYAHCSIDHMHYGDKTRTLAGGSACYCGIMAGRLGSKVRLVTKYGPDFEPYLGRLDSEKMSHAGCECGTPTTSFEIKMAGTQRNLSLKNFCEPLEYAGDGADGIIASPIFGEIGDELYETLRKNSGFIFVDPQGFIRSKDSDGRVSTGPKKMNLEGVDAIKVDDDEIKSLTGGTGDESVRLLQKMGVKHVLHTDRNDVSLYVDGRAYSLHIKSRPPADMVGLGDILSAAFCSTMIKENDFLWALCFACGAVQAACESGRGGLEKIPKKGETVTNASYFYNTVDFRQA